MNFKQWKFECFGAEFSEMFIKDKSQFNKVYFLIRQCLKKFKISKKNYKKGLDDLYDKFYKKLYLVKENSLINNTEKVKIILFLLNYHFR